MRGRNFVQTKNSTGWWKKKKKTMLLWIYSMIRVAELSLSAYFKDLMKFWVFETKLLFFRNAWQRTYIHTVMYFWKNNSFPAGVLRRRLLHRNGNFVPPAPWIRTRRRVKTGFRQKTGRSRAVYESIRKISTGKIIEISVASQPSIRFFPPKARNGPFRPFFGP